ncbi:hypothetical protein N9917_01240 [Deltaproteobacteria bacterium]|nr:hypothetical protein [Deltaproteobacteria bacterium]
MTAEQAGRTLPALVILILMGRAQVSFPGSDTPSPARKVIIIPKEAQSSQGWLSARGISVTGPMEVRWDQWQNCMVPLIESIQDPDGDYAYLNVPNPLNRASLCHVGDARRLMDNLSAVIVQIFEGCGYGSL